jgi:hypothetical protein
MRIGVADPARCDTNQNVRRTNLGHCGFDILQWVAKLHQSDAFHKPGQFMQELIWKPRSQKDWEGITVTVTLFLHSFLVLWL